ncbi:helix-turn-helix domain-containing protein [Sphingobacterium faecium]
MLVGSLVPPTEEFDWLRSKAIRKMMDISPATLQNLRITGKIRHKKVMGSYYYNRSDLQKLFQDEN